MYPTVPGAKARTFSLLATFTLLAAAFMWTAVGVTASRAAGSGSASAQAAVFALGGSGQSGSGTAGLGLSGSTPVVTAPSSNGVASDGSALNLPGLAGASGGVQSTSTTATRTDSSTAAQSTVTNANVSGFGSSLLSASHVSSSVSCPASGGATATTSTTGTTVGGHPINPAAGGSANVPGNILGLLNVSVTVTTSSPHTATATSAEATGLIADMTLHATVPLTNTSLTVPLGSITLAHSQCVAPAATGTPPPPTAPGASTPTGGGPGGDNPSTNATHVKLTAVQPDQGPTAGGQKVTITGTGFSPGATTVTFGTAPGTAVNVRSASTLTVITPPHAAGAVDVTIHNATGASGVRTYTFLKANANASASVTGEDCITPTAADHSTVARGGIGATGAILIGLGGTAAGIALAALTAMGYRRGLIKVPGLPKTHPTTK